MKKSLTIFLPNINKLTNKFIRILEECEKAKIDVNLISYNDIIIDITESIVIRDVKGSKTLSCGDMIILGRLMEKNSFHDAIFHIFHSKGKRILNEKFYLNLIGRYDKLYQSLRLKQNGFRVPNSLFTQTDHAINEVELKLAHNKGLFVKPINGTRGEGAFVISNNLNDIKKEVIWDKFVVQDCIKSMSDYRLLILGGEVIASMKRTKKGEMVVTNYSAGGRIERAQLPKDIEKMAVDASNLFNLEYSGVDIMFDQHKTPFILEVNCTPQFEGIEKATGINVAKKVIEYLVSKD